MKTDSKTIADVYNQHGEEYHKSRKNSAGRLHNEFIDMPAMLSLLPKDLTGYKVLDAGCGSGIYSVKLAGLGAEVVGVDVSEKMIEIAKKELPKEMKIEYLVGELYDLSRVGVDFDFIVCAYVLENVENLEAVFGEFFRVLKNGGRCLFSVSHPVRANSIKIEVESKQAWQVVNYFDESKRVSDFGGGMLVPKFKRTIESYMKSLRSAGFVVSNLLEPRPLAQGELVDPVGFERAMRLPEVMTFELIKMGFSK